MRFVLFVDEDKENRVESWRNSLRGVANAERDSFYDKTGSAQLDHDQHSNSAALKDYDGKKIKTAKKTFFPNLN